MGFPAAAKAAFIPVPRTCRGERQGSHLAALLPSGPPGPLGTLTCHHQVALVSWHVVRPFALRNNLKLVRSAGEEFVKASTSAVKHLLKRSIA